MAASLGVLSTPPQREAHYRTVLATIDSLLEGERDWVAGMATRACEPMVGPRGVFAVLDVDSNTPNAFMQADADALEAVCAKLALRFADQC